MTCGYFDKMGQGIAAYYSNLKGGANVAVRVEGSFFAYEV